MIQNRPAGQGGGRAAFACRPERSRGRRFAEPDSTTRNAFQRDRDRIIHSTAFRRLKHKTQVFVQPDGDHFRTRLTHSLEVAQIARSVGRVLGVDEDLVEALALAHDLGHPPFGHAGEEALDQVLRPYGGFDHNEQAIIIVTRLEARYALFDGLNLTWEMLEGMVKHNGPLPREGRVVPPAIAAYDREFPLDLASHASAEAQVAALADDIAYHCHDIDDGVRAGLFAPEDLDGVPLVGEALAAVRRAYGAIETTRLIHEAVRRMIDAMVRDVVAMTLANARGIESAAEVRALGRPLVAFSPAMAKANLDLKSFLYANMYQHASIVDTREGAKRLVRDLFGWYVADPALLPPDWRQRAAAGDEADRARIVKDYVAGMTDNFALREHAKIGGKATLLQ